MTGFLLDTNVISEVSRESPDPRVIRFLTAEGDLWLSTVTVYEMEYGLALLPYGRRLETLRAVQSDILAAFDDRVLTLDRNAAEWAARFRARSRRAGRPMDVGDALIAGIARANGLSIATRNVGDFESVDLEIVNPWEYG